MIENHIKLYFDEKSLDNPHEPIESRNKTKITLRKNKLNKEIQNKRLVHLEQTKLDLITNLMPEHRIKIKSFEESYTQILSYLNSNNIDYITYALNELRIYFFQYSPNINEQSIIINYNFLFHLLKLGNIFIKGNLNYSNDFNKDKNKNNLIQILWILINIQVFKEGSGDYLKILYTKEFFEFYNDSLNFGKTEEFFNSIKWILKSLICNNENINLLILRSDVFSTILDNFEKDDEKEIDDIIITLYIINYSVDLSGQEENIIKSDIPIIKRCLDILMELGYSAKDEEIILRIYQGIYHISEIENNYNFNKLILDNFILKIMKSKFYKSKKSDEKFLKIVNFATRILANVLTESDKNCEIIYNLNIIDYYNNILKKFDNNNEILTNILVGLSNISIGKNRKIILNSIIWEKEKIQNYLNRGDDIKIKYIKILKYLIFNADLETLKFFYKSKILEYFMFIFNSTDINQIIRIKILKLIDRYLKKFKEKEKQCEEFLLIFHKFYDLFSSSEQINLLEFQEIIRKIKESLNNKYK